MVMFTLIDVDVKAQGEFIRLILAEADVKYEDKRVGSDEAKAAREDSPTGTLPILDSAGCYISETNAIARYLGALYHLYGANAFERAKIDQVLDVTIRLANYFHSKFVKDTESHDPSLAAGFKQLREQGLKTAPDILGHLEKLLKSNGGNFFAGSTLSIADLSTYFFLTFVAERDADFAAIYAKFPTLNNHAKHVAASSRVAKYLH